MRKKAEASWAWRETMEQRDAPPVLKRREEATKDVLLALRSPAAVSSGHCRDHSWAEAPHGEFLVGGNSFAGLPGVVDRRAAFPGWTVASPPA